MISVSPSDTLNTAYGRMRANEVSQDPVLADDGSVVGVLDEEDILLAVHGQPDVFNDPASLHMTGRLDLMPVDGRVSDLVALFRADKVAIVVDRNAVPRDHHQGGSHQPRSPNAVLNLAGGPD